MHKFNLTRDALDAMALGKLICTKLPDGKYQLPKEVYLTFLYDEKDVDAGQRRFTIELILPGVGPIARSTGYVQPGIPIALLGFTSSLELKGDFLCS